MKHLSHCKSFLAAYRGSRARQPVFTAVVVAVAVLGGCANLPPDLAAGGDVALERVDSRSARVGRVHVWAVDSVLRVSGTVARRYGRRGPIPGHLHIEAIGDNGELLTETRTRYHRHSVKSRRAHFSATVSLPQSEARKIRVIHHGLSHKPC